jgi:hypothetical protein
MVFVAATTLSVAIQLSMVAAVFYGLRRLPAKIKEIEGMARSFGHLSAKWPPIFARLWVVSSA